MAPSRTGRLLPSPPAACTLLPYDLVLEIVARSDVVTVVRSAATCKSLRREILSRAFIRRVCGQHGGVVPPFLVGYLRVPNKAAGKQRAPSSCFSLVHPATPAATSFSEDHLAPFLSRRAAPDIGRRHVPLTSWNGLGRGLSGICVYDPMTGDRTHLPHPPGIGKNHREGYGEVYRTHVLLTAADGTGCSFLLLAADSIISRVQTVSSSSSDAADPMAHAWGPVVSVAEPDRRYGAYHLCYRPNIHPHSRAVVLNGLIHWLMCPRTLYWDADLYILTYDVPRHGARAATTAGSIEVPKACLPDRCRESDLHLTSSPDGRLSLLVGDRFAISVWLLLSGRTDWAWQSVIDTEGIVRSVSPPHELPQSERHSRVDFVSSSAGVRSGGAVVLLRPFMSWDFLNDKGEKGLLLLDVASEEMRRVDKMEGFPYEVDMEARLSDMKIFD